MAARFGDEGTRCLPAANKATWWCSDAQESSVAQRRVPRRAEASGRRDGRRRRRRSADVRSVGMRRGDGGAEADGAALTF
jgi:hypothetical protein